MEAIQETPDQMREFLVANAPMCRDMDPTTAMLKVRRLTQGLLRENFLLLKAAIALKAVYPADKPNVLTPRKGVHELYSEITQIPNPLLPPNENQAP